MPRKLSVTTDFYDNILFGGRHFEKRHLDDLMRYCASLGATMHEWIVDTMWTLYDDDGPVGFDLLAEACEAAHRHGMEFHAVYKPFEGALDHPAHTFPQTFPRPADGRFLEEPWGICDPVRPFLIEHPEMRMARHPEDAVDPGGRIAAIRLVKNDDASCDLSAADVQLWHSPRHGGWQVYDGPMRVRDAGVEQRLVYPCMQVVDSRLIVLDGLDLPEGTRFLKLTLSGDCPFTNATERIVELLDEAGREIPATPSHFAVSNELLYKRACAIRDFGLTAYSRDPEMRAWLEDRDRFLRETAGMFWFGRQGILGDVALGEGQELALARGKARYIGGILNPIYPEVREHWLDELRFCLDRGVDGISIRPGSHSWSDEPWAYGFNPPTLEQSVQPGNMAEASRLNGHGFQTFLADAAELVHSAGKQFGLLVPANAYRYMDRDPRTTEVMRNIEWRWDQWVTDYADYVELRGTTLLRRENAREVIDHVGLLAREAGIPFILPGGPPRNEFTASWFLDHPDISAYMYYESAHFTTINEAGEFEGDHDVAAFTQHLLTRSMS